MTAQVDGLPKGPNSEPFIGFTDLTSDIIPGIQDSGDPTLSDKGNMGLEGEGKVMDLMLVDSALTPNATKEAVVPPPAVSENIVTVFPVGSDGAKSSTATGEADDSTSSCSASVAIVCPVLSATSATAATVSDFCTTLRQKSSALNQTYVSEACATEAASPLCNALTPTNITIVTFEHFCTATKSSNPSNASIASLCSSGSLASACNQTIVHQATSMSSTTTITNITALASTSTSPTPSPTPSPTVSTTSPATTGSDTSIRKPSQGKTPSNQASSASNPGSDLGGSSGGLGDASEMAGSDAAESGTAGSLVNPINAGSGAPRGAPANAYAADMSFLMEGPGLTSSAVQSVAPQIEQVFTGPLPVVAAQVSERT